jgi:hypothetical protein
VQALFAPPAIACPRPGGFGKEKPMPTATALPWFSRIHREFEAGTLTRAYRDVLLELGRFDRCRLGIFPSHRTLAARARCGVRTVQRALQAARRLGLVEWTGTRVRAAWRSLCGPNRYVLKVPAGAVCWLRRTGGQSGRRDTNERKQAARERSGGAIAAMLEAARGLPDLLRARREAMEARWWGELTDRWGGSD